MKKLTTLCAITLFALTSFSVNAQTADETKKMEDYMTPGDVHKMIAKWDGKWNEEISLWMTPGAPPTKSTGSCTNKMILGGRYQETRHSGNMMGMPFEGIGTLGWDNARKILVSSWIDNFGTGIMYMEGTWDNATKTATLKGKTTDPSTGQPTDVREVFKIVDDNTQSLEMYISMGGQDYKTMEIIFKRAK